MDTRDSSLPALSPHQPQPRAAQASTGSGKAELKQVRPESPSLPQPPSPNETSWGDSSPFPGIFRGKLFQIEEPEMSQPRPFFTAAPSPEFLWEGEGTGTSLPAGGPSASSHQPAPSSPPDTSGKRASSPGGAPTPQAGRLALRIVPAPSSRKAPGILHEAFSC